MPHIHLANIACGVHAGSPAVMEATLALARHHQVRVAAHPGYPDREFFGRRSLALSDTELAGILNAQLDTLTQLAEQAGLPIEYIKPHGALYNDMVADPRIRTVVMQVIANLPANPTLVILATQQADAHREEAHRLGVTLAFEAFADRGYDDNGILLPRSHRAALLTREAILRQVRQLRHSGTVSTLSGKSVAIAADTLCIHGDHPDSVAMAAHIRNLLDSKAPPTTS